MFGSRLRAAGFPRRAETRDTDPPDTARRCKSAAARQPGRISAAARSAAARAAGAGGPLATPAWSSRAGAGMPPSHPRTTRRSDARRRRFGYGGQPLIVYRSGRPRRIPRASGGAACSGFLVPRVPVARAGDPRPRTHRQRPERAAREHLPTGSGDAWERKEGRVPATPGIARRPRCHLRENFFR